MADDVAVNFLVARVLKYLKWDQNSFYFETPVNRHYLDLSLNEGLAGALIVLKNLSVAGMLEPSIKEHVELVLDSFSSRFNKCIQNDASQFEKLSKSGVNLLELPFVSLGSNRGFSSLIKVIEPHAEEELLFLAFEDFDKKSVKLMSEIHNSTAFSVYGGISGFLNEFVERPAADQFIKERLGQLLEFFSECPIAYRKGTHPGGGFAWGIEGVMYALARLSRKFVDFRPIFLEILKTYKEEEQDLEPETQFGLCHGHAGRIRMSLAAINSNIESEYFWGLINDSLSRFNSDEFKQSIVHKAMLHCCGIGAIIDVLQQLREHESIFSHFDVNELFLNCSKSFDKVTERFSSNLALNRYLMTVLVFTSGYTMNRGIVGHVYGLLRKKSLMKSVYPV